MPESFNWHVDSFLVVFRRGTDNVWRPEGSELRARAWPLDENRGWRASISNGRLVKISHVHPEPQTALRECSAFFKGLVK